MVCYFKSDLHVFIIYSDQEAADIYTYRHLFYSGAIDPISYITGLVVFVLIFVLSALVVNRLSKNIIESDTVIKKKRNAATVVSVVSAILALVQIPLLLWWLDARSLPGLAEFYSEASFVLNFLYFGGLFVFLMIYLKKKKIYE